MTLCLAIDTSGEWCSVGVSDKAGETSAHLSQHLKRGHAEHLLPAIEQLFADLGFDSTEEGYRSLERVAVTIGPGSFTGLRVGLSAARGIALARSIPCIGISSLMAAALSEVKDDGAAKAIFHVALLGRGGQVFYQPFISGPHLKSLKNAENLFPEEIDFTFCEDFSEAHYLVGSGAGLLKEVFPQLSCSSIQLGKDHADLQRIAHAAFDLDPEQFLPVPHYMREADAIKAKSLFPLSPEMMKHDAP
ncbi:tRNA (adenosine(37)-N6)-threonylcarbamoyltransferase complex dimerization subunit type 1 TsaB [Temperatibacter marinus]|uniref:N(6)-L-threonylcarbamoyladenine synthase n=1 Tax=Temperatibacter marinus TaxID=1456591 RepID=A0AA52HAN1_9PROT|nr:tRNA (adenosine(37)-N6)-threonylcarbamoyltransferase complex dimerization subunit type 1 TsaB [Temperatibacter marinus]WND04149.1 tRNA (adenosine(37)-N6)-threonylcarbamoyltransferase complex dimerization subunit type 1 TsaB [Temperatibacter marinus]